VNLQRKWRVDVLLKFPAASGDTLEVVLQNRFRVAMLQLLERFHPCIIDPTNLLERLDLLPGSRKGVCPSETAGDRWVCVWWQRHNREICQQSSFPEAVYTQVRECVIP